MIKTPIEFDNQSGDQCIYDASGVAIAFDLSDGEMIDDLVMRINLHDELVEALKDLSEIIGEMEECDAERINKSYRWICEIWDNAQNVLEKLK